MIAADANDPRGIVWIASYPRSGNTWIRIFLHQLVRIRRGRPAAENEIDLIGESSPSLAGRAELFARFMGKPVQAASMQDVVLARPKVAEAMAREANGVLTVKTHSVLGRVFNTPLISLGVSVGAIYVVRNPLDVAVSLAAYLSRPIDATITSMAAHLNASTSTDVSTPEIWGSWSENVRSWTENAPQVVKVVRYEDLIEDPVAQFTALAEHMRIGAAPAEIDEAVRLSSFAELTRRRDSGSAGEGPESTDGFFRSGRAGQWKEALTPEQVRRIVADHREEMARFGYLPA
jgi:hypothetical protein